MFGDDNLKRFNEGDVVYFISSSVFIKKATVIRNTGGFCTIRFSDGNCGTSGTRVRESKLYRTEEIQTSGDDGFSTFTLDWQIQYLPFLIYSNQEYRCWFASPFLRLQTYW